jgi:tetratricopeptide (TPR) repeat protein
VAGLTTDLGSLYLTKGDYAKAEPLFQRALEINEKVKGTEHQDVALLLNELGVLYYRQRSYAKAELSHQRALVIYEKALGAEHPDTATSLNNLARLYQIKGDYARAEPLFQRALAICEKTLGAEHPKTAIPLDNLAALYYSKSDVAKAIAFQSRARAIEERNIALNTRTGSERQKAVYLATLTKRTESTISLHASAAPNNATARDLALTVILQRKGRALDAMTDSLAALRRRSNSLDQTLLNQLQEANAQLARLVFNGPQRVPPAEHQKQIKALEERKENLEAEISTRSAEFRTQVCPLRSPPCKQRFRLRRHWSSSPATAH